MNIYSYIAQNNPDASYEVCKKYGYFNINSMEELANSLQNIVAEHGQDSFQDVLDIHPDKAVILEVYDDKKKVDTKPLEEVIQAIFDKNKPVVEQKSDCSCMKNADATPTTNVDTSSLVNHTNTYIIVGALIVSMAILSMKK